MELHNELRQLLSNAHGQLIRMDTTTAATRPGPNKWSPIEIIGHLIDSASNNHGRFVTANFQDSLLFTGYAQDHWVTVQQYQEADWVAVVTLWTSFNHHLAHLIEYTPEDVLHTPRQEHNFAAMTHGYTDVENPNTLYHLMADYVGHLRHHLGQIPGLKI